MPSLTSRAVVRLLTVAGLVFLVLVVGVVGYSILEKYSPAEAIYMTVITITTVGFREVRELSAEGRLFTIFLIICGVGVWAYAFGTLTRFLLEGQIKNIFDRRRVMRMIRSQKGHIIVCGFGRMGKLVSREIAREKVPFVVIEKRGAVIEELDGSVISISAGMPRRRAFSGKRVWTGPRA